jgi:hypothetical protein
MATGDARKTGVKRPRHDLTLDEKYDVTQQIQRKVPYRKLAEEHKCGIGQISRIAQNRATIEKCFEENVNSKGKRLNSARNHDINEAVWDWFQVVSTKHIPLSG